MISKMTHAPSVPAGKGRRDSSDQLSGERSEDSGITHGIIGPNRTKPSEQVLQQVESGPSAAL